MAGFSADIDPVQPAVPDTPSAFEQAARGLRSSVTGLQGTGAALVGRGAESLGMDEYAADRYARAKELEEQAAAEGPAIKRATDVHGLRDAYDYASGLAGSSVIPIAAGLAGGAAGRMALRGGATAGVAGASLATAPMTIGAQVQAQQADPIQAAAPVGLRNVVAAGVGGAQAVGMNVLPQYLGGKVFGQGVKTTAKETLGQVIAKNAAEGIGGGAAINVGSGELGRAGETFLNPARDTSGDAAARVEEAMQGGLLGAPAAGLGAAGDVLHGKVVRPVRGAATSAVTGAKEALTGGARAAVDLGDTAARVSSQAIRDVVSGRKGRTDGDVAADLVAGGDGVDDNKLASASPEAAPTALAAERASVVDKVTGWARDLAAGSNRLSLEQKASLDAAMSNLADKGNQATVAGLKLAQEGIARAKDAGERLQAAFGREEGGVRRSEGDDGPRRALADALIRAGVDNGDHLADGAAAAIDRAQRTGSFTDGQMTELAHALGDDPVTKLTAVHDDVAGGKPADRERFYQAMQQFDEHQFSANSLRDTVKGALQGDLADTLSPADLGTLVSGIKDYIGEAHTGKLGPAEATFQRTQIRRHLEEAFGKNTDAVLARFAEEGLKTKDRLVSDRAFGEKGESLEPTQSEIDARERDAQSPDRLGAEHERDAAAATETRYYGGGTDKKAPKYLERPDVHRAKHGNESQAERTLKEIQARNPDRAVDFISARDHAAATGVDDAALLKATDNRPDDHVLVESRGARDETRMSKEEIDGVRLDSKKYPDSKSRIGTGKEGETFDAVKLVEHMKKTLGYTEVDERGGRTLRAFQEGVAALSDATGKNVEFSDATRVDRAGTTVGELKKRQLASRDPAWMKGKSAAEINAELQQRENLREMGDGDVKRTAEAMELRLDKAAQVRIDELKDSGVRLSKENVGAIYKELRDSPLGKAHALAEAEAAKRAAAPGEMDYTTPKDNEERYGNKVSDRGSSLKPDNSISKIGREVVSSKAAAFEAGKSAISRSLGAKLRGLEGRLDNMSKTEQQQLLRGLQSKDITKTAETINDLVKKYPAGEGKADIVATANAKPDDVIARVMKSNDYGALKDSLATLLDAKRSDNVDRVVDAMNDRLDLLLKDDPQAQYDYLTRKPAAAPGKPMSPRAFDDYVMAEKYQGIRDRSTMERFLERGQARYKEVLNELRREDITDAEFKRLQEVKIQLDGLFGPDAPSVKETLEEQFPKSAINAMRSAEMTPAERQAVEDHISKVLGPSVDVEFAKLLHAGEFEKADKTKNPNAKDIIRVSVHSLDPMGVAAHESLHAFMQQLRESGDHAVNRVLFTAADTHVVRAQLRELLKNSPEALKQIENSSEERAAYMYQFYAEGKLNLGPKATGVMGKLQDFFKRVLGIWSNSDRALHVMDYFNSGEYAKNIGDRGALNEAFQAGTNRHVEAAKAFTAPLREIAASVGAVGESRLRDTQIPAMQKLADLVHSATSRGASEGGTGYINAARVQYAKSINDLSSKLKGYSNDHLKEALEQLQTGVKAASPEARLAARDVRAALDKQFEYMKEAGVNVGDLGYQKDYFPRVWDFDTLTKKSTEFKAMLQKYKDAGTFTGDVNQVLARLLRNGGSEVGVETLTPGMQHAKERVLDFITGPDAAPFLNKNIFETLDSYTRQSSRKAEWVRRFGSDNQVIDRLMRDAKNDGATAEQLAVATKFLNGVNGTLGDTISPTSRRLFSNMLVYQNVRLLALGIFSSAPDAAGIFVRGGTVGDAFSTFKRGIVEIGRGFKSPENRKPDAAYQLAEDLGVIDAAILQQHVGSAYSQDLGNFSRRINEGFFKFNLMDQYNRSMRVGATLAAVKFIGKHADGYNQHSPRYMDELGLTKADVVTKGGDVLTTHDDFKSAGYSDVEAAARSNKMAEAVNKFVDGAILRPNSAQKPIWFNDPHFALISHLKQFVYSFQENILKRVVNEAKHGNYTPALGLASYVPIMIAADMAKGVIQGGGSQPSWKQGWDAADYLWSGVQRAGLLGVTQFAADAVGHKSGLLGFLGPTAEQLGEGLAVAGGRERFGDFTLKSLPANALAVPLMGAGGGGGDPSPNFTD